ncbi:MAG: hypothetical protein QXY50_03060 [Candidatus Caldarchaeum sp.]
MENEGRWRPVCMAQKIVVGYIHRGYGSAGKAIHPQYTTHINQLRAYRRDPKTGKPVKRGDDHVDALLCALKHYARPTGQIRAVELDF